MSPFSHRTGG